MLMPVAGDEDADIILDFSVNAIAECVEWEVRR
jgi:hypothetical protein